eukprot:GHRQ01016766.1.p1 GENE.GHRQ01016766.1~~GHRQ01016766.1.p1  ORF type:complete len:141 (-),score=9.45 GHRQ01016766.1:88-510(-)
MTTTRAVTGLAKKPGLQRVRLSCDSTHSHDVSHIAQQRDNNAHNRIGARRVVSHTPHHNFRNEPASCATNQAKGPVEQYRMSAEAEEAGAAGREQDRFLPIANISRIMKKALPGNAKIAKDAKEAMQECISEFVSFITSE